MRQLKLLGLTALALFAFGSMTASAAFAAEEEGPEVLCLIANCAKALTGTFKGGVWSLIDLLSGSTLAGTAVTATISGELCVKINGVEGKDCSLWKDVPIDFTGLKKGAVACRSEATNGSDKDAIETLLALLDLHLAAEKSTEGLLQPLLLAKVLGPLLEADLTMNCGGVKTVMLGTLACLLLPGLKEIPAESEIVEILCKVNATTRDPITGTCEVLCEMLTSDPFRSTLSSAEPMDAAMEIHLKGKFNKDVFIDD